MIHITNKSKLTHDFKTALRYFWLVLGAAIVAIGLEIFLIPNSVIDGGVIGISIIANHLTKLPLGLFIVVINAPFLIIGYYQIGKTFVISTFVAVITLALFVTLLHPVARLTDDLLLATIFGGVLVGVGVGLIIKNGGSLDGTEILAILASRTKGFSIGEVVMFFNVFILGSAGLVFGWDRAMYSLIAYFVAFRTIDVVIEGLDESKSITIITNKPDEISAAVLARLGRGITHLYGKGGFTQEDKEVLYCIVTRLELTKLKSIINEFDDNAFVAIADVHEVLGGRFRKRAIH